MFNRRHPKYNIVFMNWLIILSVKKFIKIYYIKRYKYIFISILLILLNPNICPRWPKWHSGRTQRSGIQMFKKKFNSII